MKNKYRVTRDGKLIMNIDAETQGEAIALVQADFKQERWGKKKLSAKEKKELGSFISGNWEARLIQIKPRFSVGDVVSTPKNLYNETRGEVTAVERVFQEVHSGGVLDGTFNMEGLATLEKTISSIQIPYEFDEVTLKVHHPASEIKLRDGVHKEKAKTRVSKFYGWAYTVTTEKMNSVFSESSLRLVQKVDEKKWKDRALTWFHSLDDKRQAEIMKECGADPGDKFFYEYLRNSWCAILIAKTEPICLPWTPTEVKLDLSGFAGTYSVEEAKEVVKKLQAKIKEAEMAKR